MMKAVLCLALVCCFVAVVQAAGCECTPLGMMECACKPANKNGKFIIMIMSTYE